MPSSIEELKALMASKGGYASSNLFKVTLPSITGSVTAREINLLCRDVNLPGRQIMTTERSIGPKTVKVGYGFATDDITMTFLVLNDYGIREYFENWQNRVVNQETYEIGYKQDYARRVTVEQLKKGFGLPVYSTPLGLPTLPADIQNRLPTIGPLDLAQGELDLNFITSDTVIYKCILENSFPTTINTTTLNNDPNGLTELSVTLSYDNWSSEFPNSNPGGGLGTTLTTNIIGALTT